VVFQIHSSMKEMIRTLRMIKVKDSGIDIQILKLCLIVNRQNSPHFSSSRLGTLTWNNPPASHKPPKIIHHLSHLYQIRSNLQDHNIQTNLSWHYSTHSFPPWYHKIYITFTLLWVIAHINLCHSIPKQQWKQSLANCMLLGHTWHWHENIP
jgi:hypothetical protein